jgi:glycosyltransferase involved in cell wall biosynthesis
MHAIQEKPVMPVPFFSIIIPVYNDAANLPRCIDSVLSQTFADFEVLLIDDGSTDNCPAICDEYAMKDSRIRAYHQKNQGTSKSRQFGIDRAVGNYTFFADSDDWVNAKFLAQIKQKLGNGKNDILFMDFLKNTKDKEKYVHQKPCGLDTESVLRLVLEQKLISCLWAVVIKRDFYVKNKIIFSEGINYGEDSLFIIELLLYNPVIDYLGEAFYHHNVNPQSFTRTNMEQRYRERVKFLRQLSLTLEGHNRADLAQHNFFPFYDKFEMLCSGVFSKKEYHELFSLPLTPYYSKRVDFRKYVLLAMAETWLYPLARFFAVSINQFRKK